MKVLSLFDGISCGRLALERAGIPVERYVAYEIEPHAITISQKNWPDIEQRGDVCTADFTEYQGFDLLIGGSPCQDLCSCGSKEGLKGVKSRLFYEYVRALEEAKPHWFLLENNYSMTKQNRDKISEILGVKPVYINSNIFSCQDRKRLYWTNFPLGRLPVPKGLKLRDIMEPEEAKQEHNITERIHKKRPGTLAYKKAWDHIRTLDEEMRCCLCEQQISNTGATNIQYPNGQYYRPSPVEYERAQTLPDNYTAGVPMSARYAAVGNGWTVDVIAWIFSQIPQLTSVEDDWLL